MKRMLALCMITLLLIANVPTVAETAKPPTLIMNGQVQKLVSVPVVSGGEVLMSAKELISLLSGTYFWQNETKTLTILINDIKIKLQVGSKTAVVNGQAMTMKVSPKLVKNSTYIPIQFICEKTGVQFAYDAKLNTVTIERQKQALTRVDEMIGERLNDTSSGSWWGENISKIARTVDTTFTSVLSSSTGQRTAYLYEKNDKGIWTEGVAIFASRPVNILADSKGFIHVIGFEPFQAKDEHSGRIFHLVFDKPNTVKGTYQKNYLTQGNSKNDPYVPENYGTLFCGAAIGKDNTILVAYDNSFGSGQSGTNSLAVRIYDPVQASWQYETVQNKLSSRYCYPFAFVSDNYFHVLAIEDTADPEYALLPPPHNSYQFRYGAVKHFQRLRSGGSWQETTLIDFNDKPLIGKQQIADAGLRITDFTVDGNNVAHALMKYNGTYDGNSLVFSNETKAIDYMKSESQNNWKPTVINFYQSLNWAKIWERSDKSIYYLVADYNSVYLVSAGKEKTLKIPNLEKGLKLKSSAPFMTSRRSGSPLSDVLYIVLYTQPVEETAKYMEVKLE